jgi:predicted kinase
LSILEHAEGEETMKRLVVLVGLPGSGKTSYQREHSDWVVVSRSAIRQTMFRCSYDVAFEETVNRIFHSAMLEALESPADVVCIDEPNLTRDERTPLIELSRLSGREPVAHVMPEISIDSAYERMQRNLKRLAFEKPYLRVRPFSRKTYDLLAEHYEPVDDAEGFTAVERAPFPTLTAARTAVGTPARTRVEREPLPLFTS